MSAILNVKPFPSELTAYEIALDEWHENIRKWESISGDRFNVSMKTLEPRSTIVFKTRLILQESLLELLLEFGWYFVKSWSTQHLISSNIFIVYLRFLELSPIWARSSSLR